MIGILRRATALAEKVEERTPKPVEVLLEEYAEAFVQVVRWVFAGGIAGLTVRFLESGMAAERVAVYLLLFALLFALILLPLRLLMNEREFCPYCNEPFELRDAVDLREYESHLLESHPTEIAENKEL